MKKYKNHIEVCSNCSGEGNISRNELTNYHKREYDVIYSTCHVCNGSGLVQINIIKEITPFKPKTEDELNGRIS